MYFLSTPLLYTNSSKKVENFDIEATLYGATMLTDKCGNVDITPIILSSVRKIYLALAVRTEGFLAS